MDMAALDNVKLVREVMDALLQTGDPEPLLAAITEDAVIKAVLPGGTPISGDFRGREGFLRYFSALVEVMEVIEATTTDIASSETSVVLLGHERARVKRTGEMLDCEIATIFTLRDGKIARLVAMADMTPIVDAYRADGAR